MIKRIFPVVLLLLALVACENEDPQKKERGLVISTKQFRTYTPQDIQDFLNANRFQVPFTLTHNVRAVKISYITIDPDGNFTEATGAVYLPETTGEFPIICFQHGTQTQRYFVPSIGAGNSDAGLAGAVAASMGYICVAADYLGLGDSYIVPPFLLAENSAITVIDMLRASDKYFESQGIATDGSLYLTGYSQGGHVTLATHREIEQNYSDEFQVTASAPLAGPYDLASTIDTVMEWGTYNQPILFTYLMNSYNHYYGWDRLNEIFQEPYASEIPGYFDGSQAMASINLKLPQSLESLLQEKFIADYKSGAEEDLKKALLDNSLMNFIPTAPMLLIHGDQDKTVPHFNALNLMNYYESSGKTNMELMIVEGDHVSAAEAAIVGAMAWFETLRNK